MSSTRIQIADDAVNRVTSTGGSSAYTHYPVLEKPGLRKWDTQEKEADEEKDERDVRKRQVGW